MLRITPTEYIWKKGVDDMLTGKRVTVDAVKGRVHCRSHIMMRVINLWKRPEWYDSGWFKEIK